MTRDAPIIAEIGNIKVPKIKSGRQPEPKTIISDAPSAAPAETPISPGSANGFLKRPCKEAPDRPKLAPTKAESKTLGILISSNTILSRELEEELKISSSEKLKLPREIDARNINAIEIIKMDNIDN